MAKNQTKPSTKTTSKPSNTPKPIHESQVTRGKHGGGAEKPSKPNNK